MRFAILLLGSLIGCGGGDVEPVPQDIGDMDAGNMDILDMDSGPFTGDDDSASAPGDDDSASEPTPVEMIFGAPDLWGPDTKQIQVAVQAKEISIQHGKVDVLQEGLDDMYLDILRGICAKNPRQEDCAKLKSDVLPPPENLPPADPIPEPVRVQMENPEYNKDPLIRRAEASSKRSGGSQDDGSN